MHASESKCSAPNCDLPCYCKGLCSGHYQQAKNGRPLKPLMRKVVVRSCEAAGCERPQRAHGLCASHLRQKTERGRVREIGGVWENEVTIRGDVALVALYDRKGLVAGHTMIDAADVDLIRGKRWHRLINGYAVTHIRGNNRLLYLHCFILGVKRGGDHINGNKMDNRRCNLRPASAAENAQNVVRPGRETLRNVYVDKRTGRLLVSVQKDRKKYTLFGIKDLADAKAKALALRSRLFTHANEDRHKPCRDADTGKKTNVYYLLED